MDYLNNNDRSNFSSFTSMETPQYNSGSLTKNVTAQPKSTSIDDQKQQTAIIHGNVTTIVRVGKKLESSSKVKASFYVYGDRKNGLLTDIIEVLSTIVQEKEATSFAAITNLKSNINYCEDVDLEIGKY